MIFTNIENLIKSKSIESTRIEYKKGLNPNKVAHTICAFANDIENIGGGYIVLGIEDIDGMPKTPVEGLDLNQIDKIRNEILSICNQIEPRYLPEVEIDYYKNAALLIIWCPAGYGRPYRVFDDVTIKNSSKSYYIRKLGSTIKASDVEIKILYDISTNIPYDDRPNYKAKISDLDINLIRQYLNNVDSKKSENIEKMSLEELCEDFHIISGPSENVHPLNVGVLMFTPDPEKFIPGARIEVVNMPYSNGHEMTEETFKGPIDFQLRSALGYIKNCVIREKVIKLSDQAEAVRIFNYPFAAIEEALTNAVYHKSYEINEPVTVVITNDKIEISSIPGPDISISDEDIKQLNLKSKRYRNRRIGDFLKELGLTEGRNTGIPNMIEALDLNGSKYPSFNTDENRSFFTVVIHINEEFAEPVAPVNTRFSRSQIKKNILEHMNIEEEYSMNKLAISLGYKGISKTFSSIIDELTDEGYIQNDIQKGRGSKIKRIK